MTNVGSPFTWAVKSPVNVKNFGYRPEMDKIFDKLVPVQMQLVPNEDQKHYVRLSIEFIPGGLTNSSFRKDLYLEITDDDDPYVFYALRISEEDFSILKTQQGLLVDYSSFPPKFVQLVERCIAEHQSDMPKFLIMLRQFNEMSKTGIMFEIVETNPFKHLCHLSIRLTEGSEMQLKKHLANKFRSIKEEKENVVQQLQNIEQQLEIERKNLAQKSAELEHLKSEFLTKLQDSEQKMKLELQMEKHLWYQTKCDLEQQLKAQQLSTTEKESQLQQQIKEANEKRLEMESTVKDLKKRLSKMEEESNKLQQELQSARRRGASLDADFHDKEKAVHHLRTKLAIVEQDLKTKDALLSKQQELLTAAQEQKAHLSEKIEEKDGVINRREAAVKAVTDELIKANDIIRKLQGEIKTLSLKVKTRTDVVTEQEKVLHQKEHELTILSEKLERFSKLQEEVASLQSRTEEQEKTIRSNEQIISYLNKQLNEAQLRKENAVNYPYFSTPNEAATNPVIPVSTLKSSPLVLGHTTENRENDEPLDPKYFQPKALGILRKDKPSDRMGTTSTNKPSAYFKK